ncbi:NAD synthetase / Glutamine amidotransferase chain of NAD synthetase [hydrothermal vent metagenome]|uniref:NAD(+) synthase (glutamine-hydrolyzing) n=1 Tax=hydrothermal vent metagenome TaxID=652676 RepID=A0A3B0ZP98_9ZZZZ
MNTVKLVVAQLNFIVGNIEANRDIIITACRQAVDQNARIIIFPELALTGYPPEDLLLRPELYQRCDDALQAICREFKKYSKPFTVILGYPKRGQIHSPDHSSGKLQIFNIAGVIQDGNITDEYAKQNLPNYKVFDEKRYFTAGDDACIVTIDNIPFGLSLCEDIWVDEPINKSITAGARCIINLNASPFHLGKPELRESVVKAHASNHQIPVIYANLVGGQDELVFDGHSFTVNEKGKVIQRAPEFESGLYEVKIDWDGERATARAQTCSDLLEELPGIYQALVTGVRDYVHKNGFTGAVLGLSGGIDSALTLAIAVDALGAEQVEAVSMPSRYTANMSVDDARQECEILGVNFALISIEKAFDAFLGLLKPVFGDLPADTTEENIQARCRGILLMAISNKKRKIVLTTGNKSEMAVGYATLYGDMAGGFDVLKDVSKTRVFALSNWRNQQSPVIPQRVIDRPPSAELALDQKDSDSLPDYEVLDPILEHYIEHDKSAADMIAEGYAAQDVSKVMRLVDTTEYKRRQAPPGVRITERAFGRDRRYPVTSGFHQGRATIEDLKG